MPSNAYILILSYFLSTLQVILDLLHRVGALSDGKVKIIFIDTFHLFPETHQFLSELEVRDSPLSKFLIFS